MQQQFFYCDICGNIMTKLSKGNSIPYCCGKEMKEMEIKTDDSLIEKHLPHCSIYKNRVHIYVSEIPHPMNLTHQIVWIAIETSQGFHIKYLPSNEPPSACFALSLNEKLLRIYSYCNIHGLWQKSVNEF